MITVVKRLRSILTNYMEGNFLSRYNNKIDAWKDSIDQDPCNKSEYEREIRLHNKVYAVYETVY